jgi:class 3 adenylate cyclase/tetratricopeptide (TPR) repeat protein
MYNQERYNSHNVHAIMLTLLETFASYLPALVVRRHVVGAAPAIDAEHAQPMALLFADISGFTALTERLAQRGPAGVEELTRLLNISFGQILDLIETHGGDVVKFAGDALLAIWPAGPHPPAPYPIATTDSQRQDTPTDLASATLRAAQCARAIHERMTSFYRLIDSVRLTLRIGVAAGDVTIAPIGGVFGRWELLAAGQPLLEVGAAERRAQPGEVVLAPEAWALVSERCAGTPLGGDEETRDTRHEARDVRRETEAAQAPVAHLPISSSTYVRLNTIHTPIPARPATRPALAPAMDATLRSFIPGAVLSRLVAGETAWLAELRRVTVLFVHLPNLHISGVGALDQAQATMWALQTALYRYEGSVNKISLDDKGVTLVAALGLPPLAHEDDAARGVLAALAMHEALHDLGLHCAIGVASGRAFCGEIGSAQRREYTMIGDVVNLAARLMQAAAESAIRGSGSVVEGDQPRTTNHGPPTVLCDETTYQLARARLAFETLPPIMVKGKVEPISMYRPLDERAANLKSKIINHKSDDAIVGRAAEQTILIERLHALLRGDPGGVVLIEGEAGMGKSTLVERLGQLAADLHVATLLGAGDATEQATPYYAWRGVFGRLLGFDASASAATRRTRALQLLGPDEAALGALLNAVLPLDLPETPTTMALDGSRRAATTRDLLLRLLGRAAERAPTLLLLEDAHWFDSASWALALAASQRVRPLLMVVALRPLSGDLRHSVATAPPEYAQLMAAARAKLQLDMLTPTEAITLVCRRLGIAALPESVAELIREKAQGHPFFSEELAYALRDAGLIRVADGVCSIAPEANLAALSFPETVQGAIISRVDRLTPTQQLTLKVASVIGRVFPVRTLQAVYPVATDAARLDDDLTALARLDITPQELAEPELAYIFKHAITQDVVYNLMLFAQRRQLHRAVAEWYEHTFGVDEPGIQSQEPESVVHGRLSAAESERQRTTSYGPRTTDHGRQSALAPFYALLAHHWSKAGVAARAVDYLEKAGRNALAISAAREARAAFEQALDLLAAPAAGVAQASAGVPDAQRRRMTLARLLGEVLHHLGDFTAARAALEQSLELARAADDRDGMSEALSVLGRLATDMGAYPEARRSLEASLALARELGEPGRIARVLSNLGNIAMREAAYDESERRYQESLALFTAIGDQPGVAQVLNGMGNGAIDRRMYDIARYCYEESLAIRRALGDRWGVAACLSNLGWVAHLQHDYLTARDRYEESLTIARAIGDRRGAAIVLNNLGFTAYARDDDQIAARHFDEALRLATEIGATPLALEVIIGVARLRARAGQPEQAAELLGLALHHPASNSDVAIQAELFNSELAATLPPARLAAAIERGGALTLDPVVAALTGQG